MHIETSSTQGQLGTKIKLQINHKNSFHTPQFKIAADDLPDDTFQNYQYGKLLIPSNFNKPCESVINIQLTYLPNT